MTRKELIEQIHKKQTCLCIGLDTDLEKLPKHLLSFEDPVFEFNKQIIDATKDLAVAYKPNIAFYECLGIKGWQSLQKTLDYIPEDIFTIADAKRGDIGNTSKKYAETFFKTYDFDSVTVTPYMGEDSITPFLEYEGKWVILLALTSNKGSADFQFTNLNSPLSKGGRGMYLFEQVLTKANEWGNPNNLMFVTGATNAQYLQDIRKIAPDNFLLVPGVGAQGGSLEDVMKYGKNKDCGLLINSSREIIYAGNGEDFAVEARGAAERINYEIERFF